MQSAEGGLGTLLDVDASLSSLAISVADLDTLGAPKAARTAAMLALTYALKARNRFARGSPAAHRYQIKSIASLGALCQSLYGSRGRDEKATILRLKPHRPPLCSEHRHHASADRSELQGCVYHIVRRVPVPCMGQTTCRVVVEGRTVEEILSFDYSSDVMAIAEEAHFSVENKTAKYRDQLRLGQQVEFILQNKHVNGGAPTVKHRGVIVRRNPKINPSGGSVINITSADLGWHIQNSDAPLWMRLQGKTFADICDPATSPFSTSLGASRVWTSQASRAVV